MLLDKYIENALYLYQCVIVPGFGGFIAVDDPEAEKNSGGKFRPAGKKFTFNPALKVNDGVLAMYISNMREIAYADAMAEIAQAVDFYLSTLEKGDAVDIAGVGVIRANGQAGLTFTQTGIKNFSRGQYGLTSTVAAGEEKRDETGEKTTYEHQNLVITPVGEEDKTEEEGVDVMKKAFRMVVDAATSAGIKDNTVENRAIGDMINAVLMEAAEKATIEQFRDSDQAARSLISSAADRAKKEDDKEGNQAIDDILKAVLTEEVAKATQEQYRMETFSAEGFINVEEPGENPEEEKNSVEGTADSGNASDGTDGNEGDNQEEEEEEEGDDNSNIWRSKPVKAVVSAIVILAVLVGLFFFVHKGGANLYFWKDEAKDIPITPIKDTTATETDTLKKDSLPSIEQTVASLVSASNPDVLDTAYMAEKPFYLIASAVESRENAKKYLDDLRAQGYKAEYAGYQKGLYLIAYQGFYSRTEAQKMYNDIVDHTDNLGVWIKVYNRNADKKTD